MILTAKQQEGLRIAINRYKNCEKYTVIAGYAGTGKSTLVRFIIQALDVDAEDVAYVAYTGKASEVLRKKGCPNATTAHKLLYYSKQKSDGKFSFYPRITLEHPYKVIVVDEISMLPASMWNLLLQHRTYVLALGDPFQIPPIVSSEDNHLLEHPHVFLDEIMRQAKESDIIRLSMDIREYRRIKPFMGNDVNVVAAGELCDGMYEWADQVLCATNRVRKNINDIMRDNMGFGPLPQEGDKVICLRNSWDTCAEGNENPLVNGTIGWIDTIEEDKRMFYLGKRECPIWLPVYYLTMTTADGDIYTDVLVDKQALDTGIKSLTPRQEYLINKDERNGGASPLEFNPGYALSVHRAQGSEWPKVTIVEERFPFDKETHARHLYTGVTRASQKLTLVLNQ